MTSREFRSRIGRLARKQGMLLEGGLIERLEGYYQLLARWNRKINLTAFQLEDGGDEVFDRLLIEPLAASRLLPAGTIRLVDIGSGGGSPAIPIKLATPDLNLTMVESKVRKSAFLREAVRQLDLFATVVENARYEELLVRPDLHERADVLTVRAVRIEARSLMALQVFVRPGGSLYMFRGPSGPDVPARLPPPLVWAATHPLLESTRARLVVLEKSRGAEHC